MSSLSGLDTVVTPSGTAILAPTRWSLVPARAKEIPEARAALSELCGAYCEPVLRSLRSRRFEEEHARDLCQEFFCPRPSGAITSTADPRRGRFRSYLPGAPRHFLFRDPRERDFRQKRGGGVAPESPRIVPEPATESTTPSSTGMGTRTDGAFPCQPHGGVSAGRPQGMVRAAQTMAGGQRSARGVNPSCPRSSDCPKGALKVAIHRLRRRFREALSTKSARHCPRVRTPSTNSVT